MRRHPHDIVPRDDKDEILVAIYDVLVEIRDALVPAPIVVSGPVPADAPVSEAEASEAGTKLAAHRKAPAKKPASKKPAARKKPA